MMTIASMCAISLAFPVCTLSASVVSNSMAEELPMPEAKPGLMRSQKDSKMHIKVIQPDGVLDQLDLAGPMRSQKDSKRHITDIQPDGVLDQLDLTGRQGQCTLCAKDGCRRCHDGTDLSCFCGDEVLADLMTKRLNHVRLGWMSSAFEKDGSVDNGNTCPCAGFANLQILQRRKKISEKTCSSFCESLGDEQKYKCVGATDAKVSQGETSFRNMDPMDPIGSGCDTEVATGFKHKLCVCGKVDAQFDKEDNGNSEENDDASGKSDNDEPEEPDERGI